MVSLRKNYHFKKWVPQNTTLTIIILLIIIIIWDIPRDLEIQSWCPAEHSLISWRQGSSLLLVGNPSRDGVSIKILVWRTLNPTLSYYEWIMPSNEIETNDVNGSRFAEQGPSSGRCSLQGNIGPHHTNPAISKRRKWTSQENKIVMECYLLSEPMIRGYRKHVLSLWLLQNKD